jgi:spermidine synthase
MWYPGGELLTGQAVTRSFAESFTYTRSFSSVEGWGLHLLGSQSPMTARDAKQLVARMPVAAQKDLLEWADTNDPVAYFSRVINREYSILDILNPDPEVEVTDDQPYNEYFLLRRLKNKSANP